jgi:hypothetical protein
MLKSLVHEADFNLKIYGCVGGKKLNSLINLGNNELKIRIYKHRIKL